MKFHKTIASVFGIGYVKKGGGTIAAIAYCFIWWLLPATYVNSYWQVVIIILLAALGTWCSNKVDAIWGKDSSKVVIDEVAGMALTLLLVPQSFFYLLAGLVAFRFFDIVKPLGIKKMEQLPKGWGVMADDMLAGLYAFILVQVIIQGHFFNVIKPI